jgi:beta-galactosidase
MTRILMLLLFCAVATATLPAQPFKIGGSLFLLNGKPIQILSGEMHFARIPREYWADRLAKARAMGLNTVCTYVFWNAHEAQEGKFDFTGMLDVAEFVRQAQKAGLLVILRPGPYACAEWDFGGLPPWLLKDSDLKVRCMNKRYIDASKNYLVQLGKQIKSLQITRGGPIIMVQLENEYGSFGSDKEYLRTLKKMLRDAGFEVPIYTSDGPARELLLAGTLDDVPPVINFSDEPEKSFSVLESFRPGTPPMSGEFWVGWFTHWGDGSWGKQDDEQQLKDIAWIVQSGRSINFYMFHGGTNFGFSAGANYSDRYEPTVTSYDYDAPLDEAGRPRPKYFALRELLKDLQPKGAALPDVPPNLPSIDIPEITVSGFAPLFGNLPKAVRSLHPRSMEYYGQNSGYILYRTHLVGKKHGTLKVSELHDYGYVYLNGKFVGKLNRAENEMSLKLPEPEEDSPTLDILVEAFGRINFGPRLIDRKGITDFAAIGEFNLTDWEVYTLPMDGAFLKSLRFSAGESNGMPGFYRGTFSLDATGDTYLNLSEWKKGVVWVNGHNLGRYWEAGPQRDLFVPGAWLKKGENSILVFDMEQEAPAPIKGTAERGGK